MMDAQNIPEIIKSHLQGLADSKDIEGATLQELTDNWLEKYHLFIDQTEALSMISLDAMEVNDPRGALMLTSSGSLLSLGVLDPEQGTRSFDYSSIKLRSDVPEIVRETGIAMSDDIHVERSATFSGSVIQKTSPIFLITACDPSVPPDEQEKRIKEATIYLTNGFLKINHSLSLNEGKVIDRFSMRNMSGYIARLNGLTAKQTRQILDDFLTLSETGVLLGERVSLGRLGRITLRTKPAQKARVARNPATGDQITIPAKPATPVPRMRFSSSFKEKASKAATVNGDDTSA